MTPEDAEHAGKLLAKLEPGYMPKPVFDQITRIACMPILEIVPVRRGANGTEVLLLQRPVDDPVWPGELHTPGTVIRGSDRSLQDAIDRVIHDELGNVPAGELQFATTCMHHSGRGMEIAQVYVLEIFDEPRKGSWHDAHALPDTFVTSQLDFVPQAIGFFEAQQL